MSCSKEGRRLLFAFLARLLQFAPSELTMFAGGQKDGNVIVILNLFISSGTRWPEEEASLYLFAPPSKWELVRDGLGHCREQLFGWEHIQSKQWWTRFDHIERRRAMKWHTVLSTFLSISNREDRTDEHPDRVAGENMQIVLPPSLSIAVAGLCAGAPYATTHQPTLRLQPHRQPQMFIWAIPQHRRPVVICSIGQIWWLDIDRFCCITKDQSESGQKLQNYCRSTNRAHSAFAPFSPPPLPRSHKLPNERFTLFYTPALFCPFLLCNLFHAQVSNPTLS